MFPSLHFLVEVTRVRGTKASPEQVHECLLQIAGEGKQRQQGTFSTDSASCSEVSGSYFPHLSIKGKQSLHIYRESSEERLWGSTARCFKLPKHLDATAASICQSQVAKQKCMSSWFWRLGTGQDIPAHQVHLFCCCY